MKTRRFRIGDSISMADWFTIGMTTYRITDRHNDRIAIIEDHDETDGYHEGTEARWYNIKTDEYGEYIVLFEYKGEENRIYAEHTEEDKDMMNTIAIGTQGTDEHGRKVVFAEDGWHIVKKNGEISTRKTTDTEIIVDKINEDTIKAMEVLEMIEHKTEEQITQEIAEIEQTEAITEEIAQEIEPYDAIGEMELEETEMDTVFNTVKIIPIKGTENVRVKLYRTNKFIADIGLYGAYEMINDSKTGKEKKQRIDRQILTETIIMDAEAMGYIYKRKQTQAYNGVLDIEDCIEMLAIEKIMTWNEKNPQHTLVIGDMDTYLQVWDTYSDGRIKDATITINTTTFDNYKVEVMVYVKSGQTTALKGYNKVAINKQRKEDQKKVGAQ